MASWPETPFPLVLVSSTPLFVKLFHIFRTLYVILLLFLIWTTRCTLRQFYLCRVYVRRFYFCRFTWDESISVGFTRDDSISVGFTRDNSIYVGFYTSQFFFCRVIWDQVVNRSVQNALTNATVYNTVVTCSHKTVQLFSWTVPLIWIMLTSGPSLELSL